MKKLARLAGHFFVCDLSLEGQLKGFFLQLYRRLQQVFLYRRWLT
jgi:hypothetical protein